MSNNETREPKFLKIREIMESEDMDDYFRIFEMTARAQSLPEGDWVANLVPKLTEKAKSIYLEIPDPACQGYFESRKNLMRILFSGETGPVGTSIVAWPLPRLQGMQKRSSNK